MGFLLNGWQCVTLWRTMWSGFLTFWPSSALFPFLLPLFFDFFVFLNSCFSSLRTYRPVSVPFAAPLEALGLVNVIGYRILDRTDRVARQGEEKREGRSALLILGNNECCFCWENLQQLRFNFFFPIVCPAPAVLSRSRNEKTSEDAFSAFCHHNGITSLVNTIRTAGQLKII